MSVSLFAIVYSIVMLSCSCLLNDCCWLVIDWMCRYASIVMGMPTMFPQAAIAAYEMQEKELKNEPKEEKGEKEEERKEKSNEKEKEDTKEKEEEIEPQREGNNEKKEDKKETERSICQEENKEEKRVEKKTGKVEKKEERKGKEKEKKKQECRGKGKEMIEKEATKGDIKEKRKEKNPQAKEKMKGRRRNLNNRATVGDGYDHYHLQHRPFCFCSAFFSDSLPLPDSGDEEMIEKYKGTSFAIHRIHLSFPCQPRLTFLPSFQLTNLLSSLLAYFTCA